MRFVNNINFNEHTTEHFFAMILLPKDVLLEYSISMYMMRTITDPDFDCMLNRKLITFEYQNCYSTRSTIEFVILR